MKEQVSFLLKLENEDIMWKNLDKKLRNQIRKSQSFALKLREGKEYLNDFFVLYQKTMKKVGSPPHGLKFFEDIIKEFQDRAKIFMVEYLDVPIAGMVLFQFGERAVCLWAASDPRYNHINPNDFLYWEVVKLATADGFKYFDFGRTSKNSGVYHFKKQWGAEELGTWRQYYSPSGKKLVASRKPPRIFLKIWKLLPSSMANWLGPILRKYLN